LINKASTDYVNHTGIDLKENPFAEKLQRAATWPMLSLTYFKKKQKPSKNIGTGIVNGLTGLAQ
jgi:hypothetical protein